MHQADCSPATAAACTGRAPRPLRAVASPPERCALGQLPAGPQPRRAGPGLSSPRTTSPPRCALQRELGIGHVLAQVLVRRGLCRAGRRPGVPRAAARPRPQPLRRDRRGRGEPSAATSPRWRPDRRPRRLRRRRRLRHRDHGPRAAVAGGGRRLVSAQPHRGRLRPLAGHGRAAGRPRAPAADHRRLRDHRRGGGGGGAAAGGSMSSSPTTTPRAPTGSCPTARSCIPRSAATRARSCAAPRWRSSWPRRSGADSAEEDLELVALATVADLMPLQGENRRLVREGLAALANTGRPGLRALMRVSRTDPSARRRRGARLPAGAADQRRRPAAPGRRRARAAAHRRCRAGREIAAELDAVNAERRAVEQRIIWEAEAQVAELGERSAYVLAGEDWHPGRGRDRRLPDRRAPPPAGAADRAATARSRARARAAAFPGFDLLGALHACADHIDPLRRPPGGRRADHRPGRGGGLCERRSRSMPQRC